MGNRIQRSADTIVASPFAKGGVGGISATPIKSPLAPLLQRRELIGATPDLPLFQQRGLMGTIPGLPFFRQRGLIGTTADLPLCKRGIEGDLTTTTADLTGLFKRRQDEISPVQKGGQS
ncbi:hypothetical protein Tel_00240 [Candidatus Tenderia electrophaga]|uniref:Uncharacterized protein n=1 Tax=Candidatus Tenderia electrophaga TaxID=1748243 RepID=A0A0S2T936_9GAMM|nr:hypothetical protein Tel_00240 [Candidatus Tenderia electrophaga]